MIQPPAVEGGAISLRFFSSLPLEAIKLGFLYRKERSLEGLRRERNLALRDVVASGDLTVTMSSQQYRICNDRPARPTWMDEVHPREAYRATTVMEVYEIRAWEAISESGDCGFDVRFPSWDASNTEYQQRYAGLSQAEHSALRRELIETRKQLESTVGEICKAQGNW